MIPNLELPPHCSTLNTVDLGCDYVCSLSSKRSRARSLSVAGQRFKVIWFIAQLSTLGLCFVQLIAKGPYADIVELFWLHMLSEATNI